jgi:thiol:disulfide interchange protein DsbD
MRASTRRERTARRGRADRIAAGLFLSAILLAVPAMHSGPLAQALFGEVEDLVTARAALSLSKFHPGSTGYLAVTADIIEGWHINSNTPLDEYLIPTVLDLEAPDGIILKGILYPEPSLMKLDISDTPMSLYEGHITFGAVIAIADTLRPGVYTIRTTLGYQGCNNATCVEPAAVSIETDIHVAGLDEPVEMINEEIFSRPPFTTAAGTPATAAPGAGSAPGGPPGVAGAGAVGGIIEKRGLFLAFVFIYIAGLALNLTPCIYPLIPITVSFFGGQSGGRASRAFLLALVYVLGMSITYSVLGVAAATTGNLFGSALQNPWVVLFIAAVLVGLAASMFGLWEIRVPSFLTSRTGTAKQGFIGALFMGLTVGVLAAPCIGPFVLGLLTYVGNLGKPTMGFFMFFTLAWGLGTPFILLGTVSGSIARLPRSGDWMIWVRKLFGFILLAMAFYFARPIIGPRATVIGYIAIAVAAGLYLGWMDRTAGGGTFTVIRRALGLACIAGAVLLALLPGGLRGPGAPPEGIVWTAFSDEKLSAAAADGRPAIIDFTADWCIPCHELERSTFSDPSVVASAKGMAALRVDMTRIGQTEKALKERYGIKGIPTILFFDAAGRERSDLRVAGYIGPDRFRRILEQVREGR